MEKRGRQIFSKIVRASKLTRQRTQEINNAHLDRKLPLLTAFARSDKKNFLIHGELTETNKGLLFFSELGGNLNFPHFSFKPLMLKLTKLDTKRLKLSFATFEDTVKI